jgi:hypothetical protein
MFQNLPSAHTGISAMLPLFRHVSTYEYRSRSEGSLSWIQAFIKTSYTHNLQSRNILVICPKKALLVGKENNRPNTDICGVNKALVARVANSWSARLYYTASDHICKSCKSDPCTGLDRPWAFQEPEAPIFHDHRHMKVVRLLALRTGRL